MEEELESDTYGKDKIAVVYGKQDYMWQVMIIGIVLIIKWRPFASLSFHKFVKQVGLVIILLLTVACFLFFILPFFLFFFMGCLLYVSLFLCVCTRVNLSMWRSSVKNWKPMPQSTSLQDMPLICPASSETMACWLRNTSYSFSAEPRSDKSWSQKKATNLEKEKIGHFGSMWITIILSLPCL